MNNFYAAIDVGSNSIKFKIIQYINGEVKTIEQMNKITNIGKDVHRNGVVSQKTIQHLIETLSMFNDLMIQYNISKYRAVATGSVRRAENSGNIVDILLMKTGIYVEVIEDSTEKFLTYKSLRDHSEKHVKLRKSALLIELNTRSCDISMYHRNQLIFNEELMYGIVILQDTMRALEPKSNTYTEIIDEYVKTKMSFLTKQIKSKKIKHCLAIGDSMYYLGDYFQDKTDYIESYHIEQVYLKVLYDQRKLRKEIERLEMDWYDFALRIIVYYNFMVLTQSNKLLLSKINLLDGLLATLLEDDYGLTRYHMFNKDTLFLARAISSKYGCSKKHSLKIEKNAMTIFKGLSKEYPFNDRDLLYLRISANLHEIGKFTRMKNYYENSYEKIKALNIMGMTEDEMIIVANICRYMKGSPFHKEVNSYDKENVNSAVFKLAAILGLADALDKSKKQKITITDVILKNDKVEIYIKKNDEITLEEWAFSKQKNMFKYIYGITPILIER